MKEIYNWLFHYNHHTDRWAAFKREDKEFYFNGMVNNPKTIYSNNIESLIGSITYMEGKRENESG